MTDSETLEQRVDRIEQIIERLESEELSLREATALRDEANELLEDLQTELDVGDGTITELEE